MKELSVEQAIADALAYAKKKDALGLLINSNDRDYDVQMACPITPNGDKETVYSIISMYSEHATWSDQIEEALYKHYSKHFN